MSSTSFTFDLEDANFVLFEQLKLHEQLGQFERYGDLDRGLYQTTLDEAFKVARDVLAPINVSGDREGCTLDDEGNVTTPSGYREAWKTFAEGGWTAPRADPELGGSGMPATMGVVLTEMFSGANMAFMMYPGLSGAAARMASKFADERYRNSLAEKIFTGEWGGTMCLTEAGAGTSVGDNRTKATPTDEEGVFLIEGEKIFITGGDQDLTENIVHLVLARTPDAPSGIKGLSLFLVPKFDFDPETLEMGERNGAKVLKLEHKMGIQGSATCVLGFGIDKPCRGYLLGKEREGIGLMFNMMNEARIGVGVQGLSAASASYQYAMHYANERVQGTKLADFKNANAERVTIVNHPDVRRMLMESRVLVQTMRSLAYKLALDFDVSEQTSDEKVKEAKHGRVELLLPLMKSICTDLGFDVAVNAIQVFGGYGYTQEFPVEQIARDAKIQSIYEGTNGIQALDLLGRKMRMAGGKLYMEWMQDAQQIVRRAKELGFEKQAAAVDKGIQSVGAAAMHIGGVGQTGNMDGAMLYAVPFLRGFGTVVLGVEALDQACVAKVRIDADGETDFLKGKLLNLDYYVANLLPRAVGYAKQIQSGDESALDSSLFTV